MGIQISDEPCWIEVPEQQIKKYGRDGGKAYVEEINRSINPKTKIAVVLIRYENYYPVIKKALDAKGIIS